MNNTTKTTARCARCGRALTSARALRTGYGPTCYTKVRAAAREQVDLTDYRPHQVASARELIEDAAIIPLRSVIYIAVSTDGTETYRVAPHACNCPAGLRGAACYHQAAARILTNA